MITTTVQTSQSGDLFRALQVLGLDEDETSVYLTILEIGPSSVWDISQKSAIKRTSCYDVLDRLVTKAYASKTTEKKRTIYSVISPKQLFARFEQKQALLRRTLPQLEALASNSVIKPKIRLFEGSEGVREAYYQTLEQPSGSELLIYGTDEIELHFPNWFSQFIADRVKKEIQARAIFSDKPFNREILKRDQAELRQTRFLPVEEYNPTASMNLCGDTIIYVAFSGDETFGTVIESATLATAERERFNLLWKMASE